MAGRLGEAGLGDEGVYETLDLCLECRACKAECPVGVDVARFKSEFLADYGSRHGVPLGTRLLGNAHRVAAWGSRLAPLSNWVASSALGRAVNERMLGIDRRRTLPVFRRETLRQRLRADGASSDARLFVDTFTNYYDPEIGTAVVNVLTRSGLSISPAANHCCGRPQISRGLLDVARRLAEQNVAALYSDAEAGRPLVFCEPSCLSSIREDMPDLLRGEARQQAKVIAGVSVLFEEIAAARASRLPRVQGPPAILLHGHCHQRSMGLVPAAQQLLALVTASPVTDIQAGCCGMAGSFGYERSHYDVSRLIAERRLLPALRNKAPGTVVIAAGTSCRHQIYDLAGDTALHPAVFLETLLQRPGVR
jgi:Fe-S oxidoreductase